MDSLDQYYFTEFIFDISEFLILIMILSIVLGVVSIFFILTIEHANMPENPISRNKKWKEKITDKAMEESFEEYILNPENYQELHDKIMNADVKIPLYKEGNLIPLVSSDIQMHFLRFPEDNKRNIAAENRKQILRWLMAMEGKLLVVDAEDGITFLRKYVNEYEVIPSMFKKNIEDNINFVLWIQSEVAKNGTISSLHVKCIGRSYAIEEKYNIGGTYIFEAPEPETVEQRCQKCDTAISEKTIICKKCRHIIRENVTTLNIFYLLLKISCVVYLCSAALELFCMLIT